MDRRKKNRILLYSAVTISILIIISVLVFAVRSYRAAQDAAVVVESQHPTAPEQEAASEDSSTVQEDSSASSQNNNSTAPAQNNNSSESTQSNDSSSPAPEPAAQQLSPASAFTLPFDPADLPPYDDLPNIPINNNIPFFTEEDFTTDSFETYGELDALGRCTGAFACVGADLMPTQKRENISQVRPTGWNYDKYDGIDGNYLYNRCHLIAYGLTAENANENNLITGTRYMNTAGMNDLENEVIAYIRDTGNHVLYRVTPVFEGENLIASGVLMEAASVEKKDLSFCVYAYNVQPGITINYKTGESSGPPFVGTQEDHSKKSTPTPQPDYTPPAEDVTYVLNTHSMKFHLPDCDSVKEMNQKNREDYTGTREDLIDAGYEPCGACRP